MIEIASAPVLVFAVAAVELWPRCPPAWRSARARRHGARPEPAGGAGVAVWSCLLTLAAVLGVAGVEAIHPR